jgi:plastocyanin/mono/diheme cytochrome c family protein
VIIGLVALATALTVYIADEPNRRDGEATEQDVIAIERGTELYIQYCLQCHGPDGAGRNGGDGRIGGVLNQAWLAPDDPRLVTYQSDDPALQSEAEAWARYSITYGKPEQTYNTEKVMPAFGTELNVEEINDLIYLITNGDWNYVYNTAVTDAGHTVQESTCAENPDDPICEEEHPVAYPTVPPTAEPEGEEGDEAATPAADVAATVNASDANQWDVTELTVKAGDTIAVNNPGVIAHDFTIDELSIADPLEGGANTTITIPADAAPGTYTFYCSVPGHREQGMEGTITIEAP